MFIDEIGMWQTQAVISPYYSLSLIQTILLVKRESAGNLPMCLVELILYHHFVDSFLRNRSLHDHEVTAMMKAQFMNLWDGRLIFIQT